MERTRRRFTPEFKEGAARIAREVGFSKASHDLGIHQTQLRAWAEFLKGPKEADQPRGNVETEKLRHEVSKLRSECAMLTKIVRHYFSTSPTP